MKNNKIALALLLSMFNVLFTQGTIIIIGTNQVMNSVNQHMRVFDDYFNTMQEEMYAMAESINKTWQSVEEEQEQGGKVTLSQLSFDIEEKINADNVVVKANGICLEKSTGIQAKIEFDGNGDPTGLIIEFSSQSIRLSYTPEYRFLSVEMKHETKKEQQTENQIRHAMQVGTMRHGKTLQDDIQLDQSRISYNKEEEMLTIFIPKIIKKKIQKMIPIDIK
ncbi:MAG: hypothetical protein WCD44_04515 [Candidatus Babeliales bacterium]